MERRSRKRPAKPGAITIRPPSDPLEKDDFLRLKDLMQDECDANAAAGEGPVTYTQVFVEMLRERYDEKPKARGAMP